MWVNKRIESPILNLKSIEKEKKNGKLYIVISVGNFSRIPKLSLFLF